MNGCSNACDTDGCNSAVGVEAHMVILVVMVILSLITMT